jgi:hypothetical protein
MSRYCDYSYIGAKWVSEECEQQYYHPFAVTESPPPLNNFSGSPGTSRQSKKGYNFAMTREMKPSVLLLLRESSTDVVVDTGWLQK